MQVGQWAELRGTVAMSDADLLRESARAFVTARRRGVALDRFPGSLPETLAQAYHCQDAALALAGDRIAGWKVGRLSGSQAVRFGTHCLAGPILQSVCRELSGDERSTDVAVIPGGFAAVEAEILVRLGRDAPEAQTHWSVAEAAELIDAVHAGIEIAGSPLESINDLGPQAVISDFGNNMALLIGPWIARSLPADTHDRVVRTYVQGALVGQGRADTLVGGPLESVRWLLEHCARRGRALLRGQWVSTGALTGVHRIQVGQCARIEFSGAAALQCAFRSRASQSEEPTARVFPNA